MGRWRKLHRALAIALTVACVVTSSGFTVLATESSESTPTEVVGDTSGGNEEGSTPAGNNEEESGAPASSGTESGTPASGETESGAPASGETESGAPASGETESGTPASGETESGAPASGGTESGTPVSDKEESSEEEEVLTQEKTVVDITVTFVDKGNETVAEKTVSGEVDEDGIYSVSSKEIASVVPEGYEIADDSLSGDVIELGDSASITVTVEKTESDEEADETVVKAKLIFKNINNDEEFKDLETTIEKETADGEAYTFTEKDIREVLSDGYVLIRADLPKEPVKAGEEIEIVVYVWKIPSASAIRKGPMRSNAADLNNGEADRSGQAKKSKDDIAKRPSNAEIFFDSENEAYSFNTATYWDVYQQQLGVKKDPNGTNVNSGLTLTSSTDAYLINEAGAGDDTQSGDNAQNGGEYTTTDSLESTGGWGDFSQNKTLTFNNVTLKQGSNDIEIKVLPSADIRTLTIQGNGWTRSLAPAGKNNNVQSDTTNSDDGQVTTSIANYKDNGWIEVRGNAAYKYQEDENKKVNCLGYLDQGSVVYHFDGATGIPEAGTYTLTLEYAGTKTGNDGIKAIVNGYTGGSASSGGGILHINYETATTFKYTSYNNSNINFNYSDGTSTVVGWGGAVIDNMTDKRDRFIIALKAVDGPSLETVTKYMKIYLVDAGGGIKSQFTIGDLSTAPDGWTGDSYADFQSKFMEGFTTYVTPASENITEAEGIKIVFQTPQGEKDISGAVEIGFVGLYKGPYSDTDYSNFIQKSVWHDFGPFNYDNATIHSYTETAASATGSQTVKPFLRLDPSYGTTNIKFSGGTYQGVSKGGDNGDGVISGSNIANNLKWHLWTMSTSDANIVDSSKASLNGTGSFNALEIKYKNGSHQTTAALTGDVNHVKSGEWLAITMKAEDLSLDGEQDNDIAKIKIVLKDENNIEIARIPLKDFKTATDDTAQSFEDCLDELVEGYRTLYYHLGSNRKLRTVEFDFSDLPTTQGDDTPNRMYIKDIYLFNPDVTVKKTAAEQEVAAGGVINYSITVANSSNATLSGYKVTDTLPGTLTYVSDSAKVNGSKQNPDIGSNDGRVLLTFNNLPDLAAKGSTGDTVTITFQAKVPDNAMSGTTYRNSALVIDRSGNETISNRTKTTVSQKSNVFYAEVGTTAYLPINLGILDVDPEESGSTTSGTSTRYSWNVDSGDAYQEIEVSLPVPAHGDICFTTKDGQDAGIVMDWIQFNDGEKIAITEKNAGSKFSEHTDRMKDTKAEGEPQENYDNKVSIYYDSDGYLNNFHGWGNHGYIQFSNVNNTDSEAQVTIRFRVKVMDYTHTFEYWSESDVSTPEPGEGGSSTGGNNVYSRIVKESESTIVKPDGSDGMNFNLEYTSKKAGAEVFQIMYYPGGDTTAEERSVDVTVYNYQVQNHVYVLDYGLKVDLSDASKGCGLLQDADLTQNYASNNDIAQFSFVGLSQTRRNTSYPKAAIEKDYVTSYGQPSLQMTNGTASYTGSNEENLKVLYEPTKYMDSVDTFFYGGQMIKNDTNASGPENATPVMEGEIKVMPANVVYYEDNFAAGQDGQGEIIFSGNATTVGEKDLFQWQTNDQDSQYGFDEEAYKNAIAKYSNGNAHELQIDATASFTFTGTGFDIIGRTNNKTGVILAMIYKVNENNSKEFKKFVVVDTYYENGDLYQIPVVSVLDLNHGTYEVVLTACKGYADDYGTTDSASTVYVDGVRIYNPLGQNDAIDDYNEAEQNAEFIEMKTMIFGSDFKYDRENPENSEFTGEDAKATLVKFERIKDNDLYLDGATIVEILKDRHSSEEAEQAPNATMDLLTYAFSGPNKELYLEDGYGVGFDLSPVDEETDEETMSTLQIGVKLISRPGDTNPMIKYLDAEGEWKTLCVVNSSTEKYYSLDDLMKDQYDNLYSGQVVLKVDGPGTVSITNVKYKNYDFSPLTTEKDPGETIDFRQDAIQVKSGYNNSSKTFNKGLITLQVTTATDITEVKVFDCNSGKAYTLQTMSYKDKGDKRTWTIKFKAADKADNYDVQIFNTYGQFSNKVKAK